jgi:hypothetical protein
VTAFHRAVLIEQGGLRVAFCLDDSFSQWGKRNPMNQIKKYCDFECLSFEKSGATLERELS